MTLNANGSTLQTTNVNSAPQSVVLIALAKVVPISLYWLNEQTIIAQRTARFRKYYEGDHDAGLTPDMMKRLRTKDNDDGFAVNFCGIVVDTKADRCIIQMIEGIDTDGTPDNTAVNAVDKITSTSGTSGDSVVSQSTEWVQEVADNNDFDVLQADVTIPAIRDGNTFVMVSWDNELEQVVLTPEPAWDGTSGMLMIYRSHNVSKPFAALKIWEIESVSDETGLNVNLTTRLNVYYEDRVEKYISYGIGANFTLYVDETQGQQGWYDWTRPDGTPLGIPVVHFRNGGRDNYGISELRTAMPVQNVLNRLHYSEVMAAELTAFDVYFQQGFKRDDNTVMPGTVIAIEQPTPTSEHAPEFSKVGASDLTPLLSAIENERMLLAEITNTPSPSLMGGSDTASGEALKQREIGLIGKVKRFMSRAGSSWEQVFDMAWVVQDTFGKIKPPPYERFITRWKSPEIRNDATTVTNAMAAWPLLGDKETMRNLSEVYDGLTEQRIDEIVEEKKAQKVDTMKALGSTTPTFGTGSTANVSNAPNTQTAGGRPNAMMATNGQQQEMSRV